MYHRLAFRAGIKIPPNTCGKGLRIMHIGDVLVHEKTRIGENAVFHVNTAVVAGRNERHAVVGDGVYFFAGATVLKGVTVNDRDMIGAGSVVTKDITEADVCVAGVPAKMVSVK